MNHGKVLCDLLHVLIVEQGVEARLVWKGANRGRAQNVRVQEFKLGQRQVLDSQVPRLKQKRFITSRTLCIDGSIFG